MLIVIWTGVGLTSHAHLGCCPGNPASPVAVLDASINTAGAAEANFLSSANVVKTQALLGERGDDLNVIAMHSNVAYYLRTVGALTFSTSALATGGDITWGGGGIGLQSTEVIWFMGMRVIVDDMLKPTINDSGADQYPCYLLGSGSVAEGVQRAVGTDRLQLAW